MFSQLFHRPQKTLDSIRPFGGFRLISTGRSQPGSKTAASHRRSGNGPTSRRAYWSASTQRTDNFVSAEAASRPKWSLSVSRVMAVMCVKSVPGWNGHIPLPPGRSNQEVGVGDSERLKGWRFRIASAGSFLLEFDQSASREGQIQNDPGNALQQVRGHGLQSKFQTD